MSTLEVKVVRAEILEHPNADALEIARIGGEGGYQCVVGLGQFKNNDLVIYIPPDSIVPDNIFEYLSQNKITIKGGRIRAIKIRKQFSEGLCLTPSQWLEDKDIVEGKDVTEILGVTKYEPPPPSRGGMLGKGKGINTNYLNPEFTAYTCVENSKKHPKVLQPGEEVVATIKWHGTNFRCGHAASLRRDWSWWTKFKKRFFGLKIVPMEFLVGSHNKIRRPSKATLESKYFDYKKTDTYWRAAEKYNLESVTRQIGENEALLMDNPDQLPNVTLYAEIIGPGIQKGYEYGIEQGEIEIRVFDIRVNKVFLDWDRVVHLCDCFDLPTVQEVYRGPWSLDVAKLAQATDEYNGKKYNREGIVVRPVKERRDFRCGRVIFKFLSETYLLDKTNSDNH